MSNAHGMTRLTALVLALVVAAEADGRGPPYGLKLFSCNENDPSKVTYLNQRWKMASGVVVYEKTNGCVTGSSANQSNPIGTPLHVGACSPACAQLQAWHILGNGMVQNSEHRDLCMGAVLNGPTGEWQVVTSRCNGDATNTTHLQWQYDAKSEHLTVSIDGKVHCLDGGNAVGPNKESTPPVPSGQGCVDPVAKALPYCNTSLSDQERVKDLVSRMTVAEKTIHLWGSGSHGDNKTFPGVPRLGLPPFDWGLEGQHGLRVSCVTVNSTGVCPDPNFPTGTSQACPTTFPGPPGLGATFNDSLMTDIGVVLGTEARALNNQGAQMSGRMIIRTPVVNLVRDPRWGRNVECPSEDPVHSGKYAAAIISGVQTNDARGRLLAGVEMKHFAVYQVEDCGGGGTGPGIPANLPQCSRMTFDANISEAELNETYFVPFYGGVKNSVGGSPTGYMCSYNAVNGVPACANKMLSDTIRSWGFDGYCGTDCSAADGIYDSHGYAPDITHAYADAINGGTDLICNPHNISALYDSVNTGLISTEALDTAVSRAFGVLFRLGMYDPVNVQPYAQIGMDVVGSKPHMKLALEAARQSTVLLRNVDKTLPLKLDPDTKIAVIGPQGNATGQLGGNYIGSECPDGTKIWQNMSGGGGQDSWWPCIPTLAQAVAKIAGQDNVQYAQGCEQRCSGNTDGKTREVLSMAAKINPDVCNSADVDGIPKAVELAKKSDVIVLALGFDTAIAGEGHDRLDMGLPGAQQQLADAVLQTVRERREKLAKSQTDKPMPRVILVIYSTASISTDSLLEKDAGVDVVIAGHMPGVSGGTAVAEAMYGMHNDFGKLPYTVYPHVYQNQTSFIDMSFRTPPGRSHRFYSGTPLFSYGEGLSFTDFQISSHVKILQETNVAKPSDLVRMTASVQNSGSVAGSQVLFVWLVPASEEARSLLNKRLGHESPKQILVNYKRTKTLQPGERQEMDIALDVDTMAYVEATTSRRLVPAGKYKLVLNSGPHHEAEGMIVQTLSVSSDILL